MLVILKSQIFQIMINNFHEFSDLIALTCTSADNVRNLIIQNYSQRKRSKH